MSQAPVRQYLKDYQAPIFDIPQLHLTFEIQENFTLVTNEMQVVRKSEGPLVLTGPSGGLKALYGREKGTGEFQLISEKDFSLQGENLIFQTSWQTSWKEFELKITTHLVPKENTALLGLYQSGTGLCTQCEPEGFRNITFFLDRPDIMARYTTTIIADSKKFPILLSNGNRLSTKTREDGRQEVLWQDPFPKPSYLFALVAGDYEVLKDQFITRSGRKVDLEIYCEWGQKFQCHHAMAALKRSMKWDEDTYDREYDLNQYLILAVDDFNGGAMENKGLNIFNSRLIFADTTTATDEDFERVESVIAHEYFHNWTGNRITLRDWFQLSLKEGLTVFREQHYMGDMASEPVKRIDDVEFLRNKQFPEDAGPNAHPVRPESCLAVDNFYTVTVYEKGAEVIRVLKQLLGPVAFKKGMDYYFDRYDGQSITIEDFLAAFETSSGKDLKPFRRWYSQAGTPRVRVEESYNAQTQTYQIHFSQSETQPFVIPIKMSLFSPDTKKAIPLSLQHPTQTEQVLEFSTPQMQWTLESCTERPIASLFRGMTAPVHVDWNLSNEHLEFLAAHDTDGFNQWDCIQKLALQEILALYQALESKTPPSLNKNYVSLYRQILETSLEKPELSSRLLQLPGYDYVIQKLPLSLNPETLSSAFEILQTELAQNLNQDLWKIEEKISHLNRSDDFSFKAMGYRHLRHIIWKNLGYLKENLSALATRFDLKSSMNDQSGILSALNSFPSNERTQMMDSFSRHWKDNVLVINKWLTWEASLNHSNTLNKVIELSTSTHFKAANPNKVRALYGAFALACWRGFHREDGKGYDFFAQGILEVDALNPSTAARLCQGLENWYRLEPKRQAYCRKMLEGLVAHPKLSKNSFEILKRSLDFSK